MPTKFSTLLDHVLSYGRRFGLDRRRTSDRPSMDARPTAWSGLQTLEPRTLLSSTVVQLSEIDADHDHDHVAGDYCAAPLWDGSGAQSIVAANLLSGATHAPLSALPKLSSRPVASAKLVIDFDGANTPTWLTFNPGVTTAYDLDGDATTFSDAELSNIQNIWARVAELYSPFNIDVTTEDTGNLSDGQTFKVVVGGDGDWLGVAAGGVAPLGGFTNSGDNIGFAFSDLAANAPHYLAITIAHEAAHGFGLVHQRSQPAGETVTEYYFGDSQRAPIMGNAGNNTSARSLWWLTQKTSPQFSPDTVQNELGILASTSPIANNSGSTTNNGFGFRTDDHGNSVGAATALLSDAGGTVMTGAGVIEQSTDIDYFSFTTLPGTVRFQVSPATLEGMLDARLELRNANDAILATADTTSLGETLIYNIVEAGSYRVVVASEGNYGDIGQYTLTGQGLTGVPGQVANYLTVPNKNVGGDLGTQIVTAGITSDSTGALYIASQDATATLYKVVRDPTTGATTGLTPIGRILQTGGGAVAEVQALTTNSSDLISVIGFDGNSLVPKTNVGGNLGNTFNIVGLALSPQLSGNGQQRAFAIDSNGTTLDLYEISRDANGAVVTGGMTKIGGLSTPIVDSATGIPILGIQSLAADPGVAGTTLYTVGSRADQYAPQNDYGFVGDSFDVVALTVTPSDLTEIDQTFFVHRRDMFTTDNFIEQFELYQLARDPLTPAVLNVQKNGTLRVSDKIRLENVDSLEADPVAGTLHTLAIQSATPIGAVLPVDGNLGDIRNVKAIAAAVVPDGVPASSRNSLHAIVANGAVTDLYKINQPGTATDFEGVSGMTKIGTSPLRDVAGNPVYFVQTLADDPRAFNTFYFVGSADPTGRSSMFLYQIDVSSGDATKAVGQWVLSDGITTVTDVVKGLTLELDGLDLWDTTAKPPGPGKDGIPDADRFLAVVQGATGDRLISIEIGPRHPTGNLDGFLFEVGQLSASVGSIAIRNGPGPFGDLLIGITGKVGDTGRTFVQINKENAALTPAGPADSHLRGLTFGNSAYNGLRDQPWGYRGDSSLAKPDELWTWFFTSEEFEITPADAMTSPSTGLLFNINDPTADATLASFSDTQLRNWQIRNGKTGPVLAALAIDQTGTRWVIIQHGSTQYFGSYTEADVQQTRFGPLTQVRVTGALPAGSAVSEMDFTRTGELLALEQVAGANRVLAINRTNPSQSQVVADDTQIAALLNQDPRGLGATPLGRFLAIYREITTSGQLGIIPNADNNLGDLTPVTGALDLRSLSVSNLIDQTTGKPRIFAVNDDGGVMRLLEIKSDDLGSANVTDVATIDAQTDKISVSQPLDLINTLTADAAGVLHTVAFNPVAPVPTGGIYVDALSMELNKAAALPTTPVGIAVSPDGSTVWLVDDDTTSSVLYIASRDGNGSIVNNVLADNTSVTKGAANGQILIPKVNPVTGKDYTVAVIGIQTVAYDGTNLVVTGFDPEVSSTKIQVFIVDPFTAQATPAPAALRFAITNATTLAGLNDGGGVQIAEADPAAPEGTPAPIDFNITHGIGAASRLAYLNNNTGLPVVTGDDLLITRGLADSSRLANLNSGIGLTNIAGSDFFIQQSGLSGSTPLSALNNGQGISIAASPNVDFRITRGIGAASQLITLNGGTGVGYIAGTDFTITQSGLTEDMDPAKLNGGLGLQAVAGQTDFTISRRLTTNSRLQDFNNGDGVDTTSLTITLSDASVLNVNIAAATTMSQVIAAINAASPNITSSINARQDGLLLVDSSGGLGTLSVTGTAAADLGLALPDGADLDGAANGQIEGGSVFPVYAITLSGIDTLGAALNAITFLTNGTVLAGLSTGGAQIVLDDLDAIVNGGVIQHTTSPLMVRAAGGGTNPVADNLGILAYDGQAGADTDSVANARILGNPNKPRTTYNVDISNAQVTIADLLTAINTATNSVITAAINATGTGIVLTDTSFKASSYTAGTAALTVASVGASNVAGRLGLVGADGSIAGFDTAVDGLLKGSNVVTSFFNIRLAGATTIQGVIDRIRTQTFGIISASINAAQTGLDLTDRAWNRGAPVPVAVAAVTGTAALDLGILRSDLDDNPASDGVIRGLGAVTSFGIDIAGVTTIAALRTAISTQTNGVITAAVDKARSALVLTDTSFGTKTNTLLAVTDAATSTVGTALGLVGITDLTESVDGATANGVLVGGGINEGFKVDLVATDTTVAQLLTRINNATGSEIVAGINAGKAAITLTDSDWTVTTPFPITATALNNSGAVAALGIGTTDAADNVDGVQDGVLTGGPVTETFIIRLGTAKTVGDAISEISSQTNGMISTTINATLSGLNLTDTTWGSPNKLFQVTAGNTTAASDLGILTTDAADSLLGRTADGVIRGSQISYFTAPHTFPAISRLSGTLYAVLQGDKDSQLTALDASSGVVSLIDAIWYEDATGTKTVTNKAPKIIGMATTAGGTLVALDNSGAGTSGTAGKRRLIQVDPLSPKANSQLLNDIGNRVLRDDFTQLSHDDAGRFYGISSGKVWISGSELYRVNESTGVATHVTPLVIANDNGDAVTRESGITFQPSTGTLYVAVQTIGRPQLATFARDEEGKLDGSALTLIGPGGPFPGAIPGEIQVNPRDEILALGDDIPLPMEEIQFTTSGALLAYAAGRQALIEINLENPFLSYARPNGGVTPNLVGLSADPAGRFYSLLQDNGNSVYQLWRGEPDRLYISPSNQSLYTVSTTTAQATEVVELKDTTTELQKPVGDVFGALTFDPDTGELYAAAKDPKANNVSRLVRLVEVSDNYTGEFVRVGANAGRIRIDNEVEVEINGLAVLSDGRLVANDKIGNRLIAIDRVNSDLSSPLSDTGSTANLRGLVANPQDRLLSVNANVAGQVPGTRGFDQLWINNPPSYSLFNVSPASGLATAVGTVEPIVTGEPNPFTALAYTSANVLYAIRRDPVAGDTLGTINRNTGAFTSIGLVKVSGQGTHIIDMTFTVDDQLIALDVSLGAGLSRTITISLANPTESTSRAAIENYVPNDTLQGYTRNKKDGRFYSVFPNTGGDNSQLWAGSDIVTYNDAYDARENTPLIVPANTGVLANDTGPAGVALVAQLVVGPAHGTLTFVADGSFEYNPDNLFNGDDTFTYLAIDATGNSAIATVTITVAPFNDAPVNTVPGAQTTNKNNARVFSTGNSNTITIADPDAGSANVEVALTVTHGVLTLPSTTGLTFTLGDGADDDAITFQGTIADINAALDGLIFTPTLNYAGSASLQIVTSDLGNTGPGGAQTDTDTIAITVAAFNNLPTLTTIAALSGATQDNPFTVTYADLLAASNLADIDLDTLSFRIEAVSTGTLTKGGIAVTGGVTLLGAGESLVWTPAAGASGTLNAFTVRGWDGAAASTSAVQVQIATDRLNAVPTLTTVTTLTGATAGQPFNITYATLAAAANEADTDGDPLSFRIEALTSGTLTKGGVAITPGVTTLAAGETLVWTPSDLARNTTAAFTIKAFDGQATSATAISVNVNVTPINHAPTANTTAALTGATLNTAYTVTYAALLAATGAADTDPGDVLTFRVESVTTGTLTKGGVAVTAGVTTLAAGESLVWTPANGAAGVLNAFVVKATDGLAFAASTSVTVAVNAPPVLTGIATLSGATQNQPFSITYTSLRAAATVSDPNNDAISFRIVSVTSGTLTKGGVAVVPGTTLLSAGQTLVWTPAVGASGILNSFVVAATDNISDSAATAQVQVNVTAVNTAPTLSAITPITGPTRNTAFTLTYAALLASSNLSDADGGSPSFRVESLLAGTLTKGGLPVVPGTTLLSTGESFVWTPPTNITGTVAAFTVRGWDGALPSATPVQVSLVINVAPVLTSVATLTNATEEQPFTITHSSLLSASNAADANGDTLSFRIVALSTGTLTKNGTPVTAGSTLLGPGESLVWTPANLSSGTLNAFTVKAFDGIAESTTAVQVRVAVTHVNHPPTLTTISTINTGLTPTPLTLSYESLIAASNAADPDLDTLGFKIKAVSSGTLTINGVAVVPNSTTLYAGQSLVWTPANGASGETNAFTVVVTDDQADSATPVQVKVGLGVISVRQFAPLTQNNPLTITHAALLAASSVSSLPDVVFTLQAISTGTLTKAGVAITPGVTTLAPGESVVWTPARSASGSLNAFTVRATNAGVTSLAAQVSVQVTPYLFDEAFYLARNKDVAAFVGAGKPWASGYQHFVAFGQLEGRRPNAFWDEAFYLAQNPDVASAVGANKFWKSGFAHFVAFGQREGRRFSKLFDERVYLALNTDVAPGVTSRYWNSGFEHYFRVGMGERRVATALYDEATYLALNTDVAAAVGPGKTFATGYDHFIRFGYREVGRKYSLYYYEKAYLDRYPDIASAVGVGKAFRSGLEHYVLYGQFEGRNPL